MSGNSFFSGSGRMTAPERLWPPQVLAFSTTATGTSPSSSMSSGSSASNCRRRLAQARPAVPPPTIATPTSIRSSSPSSSRLTNSFGESTGGGKSAGTGFPFLEPLLVLADMGLRSLLGLHSLGELRQDLVEVADDAEVGELEDRGVRILVDRHDVLRGLHADLVLDRAGDARREVQLRRDGLARLPDLRRVGVPAGVDHRARRGDGAAERLGELLAELEALRLAEPAAAGHEEVGVLDVHVGAALLAALDHRRLEGVRGELDLHVLDRCLAGAVLGGLERVEAADDDAGLADIAHVDDRRVLEDRSLGDELAVLRLDRRDLHGHAGAEARGQAGADLEAEQAAAEQRVLEAVLGDDLGHHVDDRLREPLRALGAVDLGRAVLAERGAELVGEIVAADDDGRGLLAQLLGELRSLGDGAERVLVELALVVKCVSKDAHASSFLSSSQATTFSTVSFVSSSSMISPPAFSGGGLMERTWVREPCSPTRSASMPTSPLAFVSSGFFLAPMIALSDG